jgi:hypothetical protein
VGGPRRRCVSRVESTVKAHIFVAADECETQRFEAAVLRNFPDTPFLLN